MDRKIKKSKWTIKRISIIAVSLAFGAFLIYSFALAPGGSKLNVNLEKINVAAVHEGEFREFIPVDGNVLPIKTIRLDAIEGGVVEKKLSEGGVLIEKGDTILKLSNNNLLQNYVREETQAFRLVNDLENTKLGLRRNQFDLQRRFTELDFQIDAARDNLERSKPLFKDSIISEQEYLNIKREYDRLVSNRKIEIKSQRFDSINARLQITQLEATLSRTKSNLEMIRGNLENLYVKAPITGRLSSVDVEVGESISVGQNIGQIDDVSGFKVRAEIDEHYISRIYEGLKGTFEFAGNTYDLELKKIYPEVNSGIFQVDLSFNSDVPEGIRRGQTLQIRLQLSENITAVQIPRGSFYNTTGGNWVFVLDPSEDFATKREIRLGRQNPRFYEVLEGLKPGEKVIVSSYDGYTDKDRLVFK
ncbi:MAG: efflux RND transporter periplasmic adaptor subunit [Cyclobacteriaceae bacterium]